MTPRTVIYARYSSNLSRDASIEDQVRLCRAHAERSGWAVTQVFEDRAISGASPRAAHSLSAPPILDEEPAASRITVTSSGVAIEAILGREGRARPAGGVVPCLRC